MPTDPAEPPDALARLIVRVADEHAAQEARIAETTGYARVAQLGTGVGLLGVLQTRIR
jgi:hypothetical protein